MDNKVRVVLVLLLLVFFCFSSVSTTNGRGDNEEEEEQEHSKNKKEEAAGPWWAWHKLKNAYSIYSAILHISIRQYWHLFKAFLNYGYTRFFPPNIDFRRGDESEVAREDGAGEQLKEAIAKTLGTSQSAMEDAAKSAANIAGETMNKAKQKVKKTLSSEDREDTQTKRPNEL